MKKKLILLLSSVLVMSSGYIYEVSAAAADPALQIAQGQPSEVPVQNQEKGADGKKEEKKADAVPNVIKGLPPNLPKSVDPQKLRNLRGRAKDGASASQKKQNENETSYIILNFDNAELKDVINTIGSITNENFILSPGIDARITIHSAKKIPVSEVMNVFESVLEVNGMSLVRSGEFFKLVSASAAKQKPTAVSKGNSVDSVSEADRPITHIIPVQYIPVTEVSNVLKPLMSQIGSIAANPRNNLLIVNDNASSIKRLLIVLQEIDVNAFENTRMFFFQPKYSDVSTITEELTEILNALNLSSEGIALVPIDRINSLIIFSASPALLQTVEGWVRRLDEEIKTGQNIYVYPVQNVKAQEIADILKTLYEVDGGTARTTTTRKPATTAKTAKTRQAVQRRTTTRTAKEGMSRLEIVTFEPTNSLVILAPPGIYREMVKTIQKIDIYPREVLIEAIIAKVDISDADERGIRWSILHNLSIDNRDVTGLARGNPALGLPLTDAIDLASGPTGGFSYFLLRPGKFAAVIRALASSSKVDILQSPRLLVRDQEEASIEVGSDVPIASSTTSTTTTDTLTQSIEYRSVGIKLKIKPTISEERTVVLDLEQEVSSVDEEGRAVGGFTYPEFQTTLTKTSIVVPDEQGIIIGGIMEDSIGKSYEGIPLLSSVPLFGPLFRYTKERSDKTELIIIIIPHVVSKPGEADTLTRNYLDQLGRVKKFLGNSEYNQPSLYKTNPSTVNEP
jgi:general secretion pathway protein D